MRQNYNSLDYWKGLISENNTIRGHMLMDKLPTEKSVYIHTLIFCKESGINNNWSYFPSVQALVGYIQYSFLQEAFYIWINCKNGSVSSIPLKSVEEIISDGENSKKITKEEALNMRKQFNMIKKCWDLPRNKIISELKKFARVFNATWYGDSNEFLYLKIFEKPEELGKFVVKSNYAVSNKEGFQKGNDENIERWITLCKNATIDKNAGERFREVLKKHFTEMI